MLNFIQMKKGFHGFDRAKKQKKTGNKNIFFLKYFLRASIPVTRGGVVSQKIYNRLYVQAVS